ncbi:Agmatine/peptidylarginine deiminase [Singulisphaera sp. GP187]|uniref:agmatine deiminase family protein n=1 Tax=Singulisphaera sp. GP187 TaxID=1882752 RepID=UPI000927E174|nr:agmatine deiminase family protein [Singulisphaera sp. GP187]SIO63259.1 Agmatine/peptidylarginine deiminase [Singulisphaera sp. GP187]
MIADNEANVVYVADTLEWRFPSVFEGLRTILEKHGIPFRTIRGTRDVWCRDYLPIQVTEDRFVQFRYSPDYLTGKYKHLRADGEIGPTLPFIRNCVRSEIVLDGGNVVGRGDRAIVTDKVLCENPGRPRSQLFHELKDALNLRELIVIPQEPLDPIGHSDGMVRWLDDRRVVVNDYRDIGERFRSRMLRSLERFRLEPIEIPYCPQNGGRGGISSAVGNWANFLHVGGLIILPIFGLEDDQTVLQKLRERCPQNAIEGVVCRDLAEEGGVVNCVTWQVNRAPAGHVG